MKHLRTLIRLTFCTFFAYQSTAAFSQDSLPPCPRVTLQDFPPQDLPTEAEKQDLKGLESCDYYYGLKAPIDYVKARKIAFLELEKEKPNEVYPFAGSSMLMMIYVNGFGVKRDLNLSIRLACGNVTAPNAEERVQHLKELQASSETDTFDVCDNATSGLMEGFCQSILSEKLATLRDSARSVLIKSWSPPSQVAFDTLWDKAETFIDSRTMLEVNFLGTARVAIQDQEEDSLKDEFLHHLQLLDQCSVPKGSIQDFEKADQELNQAYAKLMKAGVDQTTTVTKEGIRDTQRRWIPYRDAWVKLVMIHCPQLDPVSIKIMLTRERTAQLTDLGEN